MCVLSLFVSLSLGLSFCLYSACLVYAAQPLPIFSKRILHSRDEFHCSVLISAFADATVPRSQLFSPYVYGGVFSCPVAFTFSLAPTLAYTFSTIRMMEKPANALTFYPSEFHLLIHTVCVCVQFLLLSLSFFISFVICFVILAFSLTQPEELKFTHTIF